MKVIEGKTSSLLTLPFNWTLDGLGYSRTWLISMGAYFIIAGPWDSTGKFEIYRWAGGKAQRRKKFSVKHLGDYHPEGDYHFTRRLVFTKSQILSDDGNRAVNGIPGKRNLGDSAPKMFRSFWLN